MKEVSDYVKQVCWLRRRDFSGARAVNVGRGSGGGLGGEGIGVKNMR